MKRFVSKSCLFALVCLAALSLLFALPMDKRVNFRHIAGDCYAHGEWIFDRIGRKNGADFLFVGSSRTLHAVDERVFETTFFEKNGQRKTALNLGYCRLGSNLPYVFLKEFLKKHRPEVVVWEIRESEDRHSHPMFGYLADGSDLLENSRRLHTRLAADWLHVAQVRVENFRVKMGIVEPPDGSQIDSTVFGYGSEPKVADPNFLFEKKEKLAAAAKSRPADLPDFSKFWIEKAAQLARENGVRLVFLYLPQFGSEPPDAADFYFKNFPGEVIFPPSSIFSEPANWSDEAHLNDAGARVLSAWLGGERGVF